MGADVGRILRLPLFILQVILSQQVFLALGQHIIIVVFVLALVRGYLLVERTDVVLEELIFEETALDDWLLGVRHPFGLEDMLGIGFLVVTDLLGLVLIYCIDYQVGVCDYACVVLVCLVAGVTLGT